MIWPFMVWGLLVIVMNAVNFTLLEPMSSAIALLNIVDANLIRHHLIFFFAMVSDGMIILALLGLFFEALQMTGLGLHYCWDKTSSLYSPLPHPGHGGGQLRPPFTFVPAIRIPCQAPRP